MRTRKQVLVIFTLISLLFGCVGGGQYAPVVERQGRAKFVPSQHKVHRGETLYSIAWRYNMDFRELASTNNIGWPYTIYPGQHLRLKSASKPVYRSEPKPPPSRTVSSNTSTNTSTKKQKSFSSEKTSKSSVPADNKRYPNRWQWPAKGRVITAYHSGSAVHKGIDIQGKLGQPVHAANSGKVVYAGSGLVGYGKLLIIKHDEHYLSAYGHNRRLLVKEGEMVKVGQKIAEFGDTGTDRVKLHFEIRRNGKPINPLSKLPRG